MAIFRVDKTKNYTVMSKQHLKNTELSLKAKGLLSMMLSFSDEWNYTTRGLASICKEGVDCIASTIKELEEQGYIVRRQIRNELGRIIDTEYTIFEEPQTIKAEIEPSEKKKEKKSTFTDTEEPCTTLPYTENPYMDSPYMDEPYTKKHSQLNNNKLNTKRLSNNQSINQAKNEKNSADKIDEIENYKEIIKENIEYELLCEDSDPEEVDELVELMTECVTSDEEYLRIAKQDIPKEAVKSRFLKLNFLHMQYILQSIHQNTSKVKNIKGYLLTTLYNAPVTMNNYYTVEVNHTLKGGKSND